MQQLLQWKGNNYYIISVNICSLGYPAGNAHAPHCRIVICGLLGSTIIFHIISWKARFSKTRCRTWNVCFDFLYNSCLKISCSKTNFKFSLIILKFLDNANQSSNFRVIFIRKTHLYYYICIFIFQIQECCSHVFCLVSFTSSVILKQQSLIN